MAQNNIIEVQVSSEIGELEAVILHTPGQEVANMTPENAERALYSDILNLSVAQKEYQQFKGIVEAHTKAFELRDLLRDILDIDLVKRMMVNDIFKIEKIWDDKDYIMSLDSTELARQLIEGIEMKKDTLTRYFSKDRFSLRPLHNFFFTRDASMSINNKVLLGKMASPVRDRETRIMEAIFDHHPLIKSTTINPSKLTTNPNVTVEGGDVIVAREDVLVIGTGIRTSSQGIDFILDKFKENDKIRHIIVQELPSSPESFIHLDMVFTFLDVNKCMVYEPVILHSNKYRTVHLHADNGKVKISNEKNIFGALNKLGFDVEPVFCGGHADQWTMQREQWHSGANFLAVSPGKLIGYERNDYTMEEMNNHGFSILRANDVLRGKTILSDYDKYVVTINGSELARGGGGARCMSMPFRRKAVNW